MQAFLWIGIVVLALAACESSDNGGGSGTGGDGDSCEVTAPTECPNDGPTYADVQPIFEERCVVCHSGPESELCPTCWSLADVADIKHWTQEIRHVMLQCSMPPRESGMTMSNTERMELLEWIRCGAPE